VPIEIVHLLNNPHQYDAIVRNGEIYIALRPTEPARSARIIGSKRGLLHELAAAVFAGVATGWISNVS
jgi:hypothetical protein